MSGFVIRFNDIFTGFGPPNLKKKNVSGLKLCFFKKKNLAHQNKNSLKFQGFKT